jgi:diguanylate cyclase (GGDEF)-like protein/PAS domain S-box-containing protein
VQLGEARIPLDLLSRQWVNYYGPAGSFPTHSLADFAAGRLDQALFKDRIVLIGGTALGSSDRHPSAFDPALPGVEWSATVIDNILTGRWLERPAWAAPVELASLVLLPLLAIALIARRPTAHALVLVLLLGVSFMAAAQGLFVARRQFISVLFPLLALLLASGPGLAYRALLDERARRQGEARLRASEERYALAAAGANDGLWDWDIEAESAFFSSRARQLMGFDETAEVRSFDFLLGRLSQLERARFQREMDAHLAGETRQFHHVMNLKCGGETRWLLVRGVAVRRDGKPVRMAGSLTNISEQKRLERQIAFDALHDRLTGLANRELFSDRITQLLAHRGRHKDADVGLVLVDIDDFRALNELHGEVAANALLIEVASRLRHFRDEGLVLARLAADQFALGFVGPLDIAIAKRIQACFEPPFQAGDKPLRLTATVAVAHSSQGLTSADELIGATTLALLHAKQAGAGLLRCFDPAEQALESSRHWVDENLDLALAAGDQLKLYYQPFVQLSDRRLLGFEALIRWHHPQRGLIMPEDFIPHAEQSDRINRIGRWSLLEVARQLVEWEGIGFKGEIAVNLSGRQFSEVGLQADLEADAREVLKLLGGVAPHRYKLEVTESMAMENPQRTTEVLTRLAGMGFKISIDDFGTGYSSLAYLNRFPFDTIKIDRSFVVRLGSGREAQEIVRTIVGLGTALAKQVLAEGVEDETQAATLHALGVHVGQGWLFAHALPPDQAARLIQEGRIFR